MNEKRIIFCSNLGLPITGLTPTFIYLNDGTSDIASPAITERDSGFYEYDLDVPVGKVYTGLLDCGATITNDGERYIPLAIKHGDTLFNKNYNPNTTTVYISDSDTLVVFCALSLDGVLQTDTTEVSVEFYDSLDVLQFTVTSDVPSADGTFKMTKVTPGFSAGDVYRAKATFTLNGEAIETVETFITLS